MEIRITCNGKLALTIAQAALRYGLEPASMRKTLHRMATLTPAAELDARTPLYLAAELDRAMRQRPGRGRRA